MRIVTRRQEGRRGRSSTSPSQITSGGERGLLSLAFAPDYASSGLLLRLLHGAGRRHPRSSSTAARAPSAPTRARRRVVLSVDHPGLQPQRRPDPVRPRTACSTPASATAAGAATSTARAATGRTSRRCSARSCASTRGAAAAGRIAFPRATRSWAAAARAPRSTPTALRNPWRFSFTPAGRPRHRRRRPGRGRGGHVVRAQGGANLGWRVWEGRSRYTSGETAPGARTAGDPALPLRRQLLDHRRRRGARPGAVGAARPLRVRRLLPRP